MVPDGHCTKAQMGFDPLIYKSVSTLIFRRKMFIVTCTLDLCHHFIKDNNDLMSMSSASNIGKKIRNILLLKFCNNLTRIINHKRF